MATTPLPTNHGRVDLFVGNVVDYRTGKGDKLSRYTNAVWTIPRPSYCIWCINYIQLFLEREIYIYTYIRCNIMYSTYIYYDYISHLNKGGDNFPSVVCLDHHRGSIQVLDGKAPDPQGTMRDVVHLVLPRFGLGFVVVLSLSFRKQMKGVGCYGLVLVFEEFGYVCRGDEYQKGLCFFCVFKFREEAIDQVNHLRMEVKMSFLLKRMMFRFLRWVFTEVSQWKWRCFWLGKLMLKLTNFGPMMKHDSSSRAQGKVPCSFKLSPFFKKPMDMKIKLSFETSFSFLLKKKQSTWKHGSVWLPCCSPWGMKNVWSTPKWRVLTSLVRKPSCRRRLADSLLGGSWEVQGEKVSILGLWLWVSSLPLFWGGKLEIPESSRWRLLVGWLGYKKWVCFSCLVK